MNLLLKKYTSLLIVFLITLHSYSQTYQYDNNGNLSQDANKDISSIHYNFMNLADTITFTDGRQIIYTYTASGEKIKQRVYNTDGSIMHKRDYSGSLLYKNDILQEVQHAEGRIVPLLPGSPLANNAYQYHLKDHLGNVRLTFTSHRESLEYLATMENDRAELENTLFQNLKNSVPSVAANHTSSGNRAIFLPANTKKGPALSLAVRKGDIIIPETYAYYEKGKKDDAKQASQAFAQILISSLSGVPGTGEVSGAASSNLPGIGVLALPEPENEGPEAYLNFQLFDKNYKPIDAGFKRVTQAANFSQEKLSFNPIEMKESGYLYVYLSNTSIDGQVVYFDDFKVTNTPIPIIQEDSYYPFGMPQEEMHDQREGEIANRNLFNGKELQDDLGLNWYDYGARMYDAALGRWHVIDPLSEKYPSVSNYVYCLNNPIVFIDPDGKEVVFAKGVSKQFKKDYQAAVQHLKKQGAGGMIASLEKSKIVYYVSEKKGESAYDVKTRTIQWDPTQASSTNEGHKLSPATILNHEIDHAVQHNKNPDQMQKDLATPDSKYGDKEEKRVIQGSEQETAKKLGEIKNNEVTRKDHEGKLYETTSPTSTERKMKIILIKRSH